MYKVIKVLIPFLGGIVFAENLVILVGYNEKFDASWGKAFFAVALSFTIPFLIKDKS
jgi:hypothetical protein